MKSETKFMLAALALGFVAYRATQDNALPALEYDPGNYGPPEGDAPPPMDDALPASGGVVSSVVNVARGIRNNNPGNIRHGSAWQGMATDQTDPAFVRFVSMPYGVRAMALLFRTYARKYGLTTPAGIISRWAPPSENATGAYAAAVARSMGVSINTPLDVDDPATVAALVRAVVRHENGLLPSLLVTDGDIARGIELAG